MPCSVGPSRLVCPARRSAEGFLFCLDLTFAMPGYPPTGLDDALPFGKHEGRKLWMILQSNPQYVRWLIEEADIDFHLDDQAWGMYQDEIAQFEKYEKTR